MYALKLKHNQAVRVGADLVRLCVDRDRKITAHVTLDGGRELSFCTRWDEPFTFGAWKAHVRFDREKIKIVFDAPRDVRIELLPETEAATC